MNTPNDLREYGKNKINQWKGMLDELEVQLALGKAEAKDALAKEQKNLSKYWNEQKAEFKKAEEKRLENRLEFSKKLMELEGLIRQKMPKSKQSFDTQKKTMMTAVHEVEYWYQNVWKDCSTALKMQLKEFKLALDNYRLALALGTLDNMGHIEMNQDALLNQITVTKTILDRENQQSEEGLKYFMDEISESFNHLKKAFSDIL